MITLTWLVYWIRTARSVFTGGGAKVAQHNGIIRYFSQQGHWRHTLDAVLWPGRRGGRGEKMPKQPGLPAPSSRPPVVRDRTRPHPQQLHPLRLLRLGGKSGQQERFLGNGRLFWPHQTPLPGSEPGRGGMAGGKPANQVIHFPILILSWNFTNLTNFETNNWAIII